MGVAFSVLVWCSDAATSGTQLAVRCKVVTSLRGFYRLDNTNVMTCAGIRMSKGLVGVERTGKEDSDLISSRRHNLQKICMALAGVSLPFREPDQKKRESVTKAPPFDK